MAAQGTQPSLSFVVVSFLQMMLCFLAAAMVWDLALGPLMAVVLIGLFCQFLRRSVAAWWLSLLATGAGLYYWVPFVMEHRTDAAQPGHDASSYHGTLYVLGAILLSILLMLSPGVRREFFPRKPIPAPK